MREADQPDLVGDFPDADILAGKYGAEVDLTPADANSAALTWMVRSWNGYSGAFG